MLTFLKRLYKVNYFDNLSKIEIAYVIALSWFMIIALGLSIPVFIYNIVAGFYLNALNLLILCLFLSFTVVYLKKHKIQAGLFYFINISTFFISISTYISFTEGRFSGPENILHIFIVLSILFLKKKLLNVQIIILTIDLYFLKYLKGHFFGYERFSDYMPMMINLSILLVCLVVFGMIFRKTLRSLFLELEDKNRELEALNNDKIKVLHILSHDIKGPIISLNSMLHLEALADLSPEEMKKFSIALRERFNAIKDCVEKMLEWSSNQINGINIFKEFVEIDKIIENVMLLYQPQIVSKNLSVITDLNVHRVYFDASHLEIIIRNIFSNAVKYSNQNGSINIYSLKNEDSFLLKIVDSGIGMNNDKIIRILNGQFTESTQGTKGEIGTGIGLSFCHQLSQLNDAKLKIESKADKGTTIILEIQRND